MGAINDEYHRRPNCRVDGSYGARSLRPIGYVNIRSRICIYVVLLVQYYGNFHHVLLCNTSTSNIVHAVIHLLSTIFTRYTCVLFIVNKNVIHNFLDIVAPLHYEDSETRIPGEYIVIFKENATNEEG